MIAFFKRSGVRQLVSDNVQVSSENSLDYDMYILPSLKYIRAERNLTKHTCTGHGKGRKFHTML